MQIYIIRHGETDLNRRGVLQGHVDAPLNESGRQLAVLTGRAITDIHFDACISSPLKRAAETAEIVLRESGQDIPIEYDERLIEMSFGEMEDHKITEMGEVAQLFLTDTFHFPGFPGGEDVRDVCARTQAFLKELVARDDGRTYLISTHGCALRAMLNPFYEDKDNFWQDRVPVNCCINIIEAEGGIPRLVARDRVYYPEELMEDLYD